jgi:putative methionine-R-sulfoxide reductase with GAF domain
MPASSAMKFRRDYPALEAALDALGVPGANVGAGTVDPASDDCAAHMRRVVDTMWQHLAPSGVSWLGIYRKVAGADEMVLGPCRDKPACSPIGLHGVCGRGWTTRKSVVVADVAVLGKDYIACDPRDRSEVVVPLFDRAGACWGVLDVDSHEVGCFDAHDAEQLHDLLVQCGLSASPGGARPAVSVL